MFTVFHFSILIASCLVSSTELGPCSGSEHMAMFPGWGAEYMDVKTVSQTNNFYNSTGPNSLNLPVTDLFKISRYVKMLLPSSIKTVTMQSFVHLFASVNCGRAPTSTCVWMKRTTKTEELDISDLSLLVQCGKSVGWCKVDASVSLLPDFYSLQSSGDASKMESLFCTDDNVHRECSTEPGLTPVVVPFVTEDVAPWIAQCQVVHPPSSPPATPTASVPSISNTDPATVPQPTPASTPTLPSVPTAAQAPTPYTANSASRQTLETIAIALALIALC